MRRFVIALIVAAGCNRERPNDPAPPAEAPVSQGAPRKANLPSNFEWTPDAKLLDQLGAPVELEGYTIRGPKKFRKTAKTIAPIENMSWDPVGHKDGNSHSSLSFWVKEIPDRNDPEQVIADKLGFWKRLQEKKALASFVEAPLEKGMLGGMPFVRVRYVAVWTNPLQSPIRGIYYAANDGRCVILLDLIETPGEVDNNDFELVHTAAMTFQRK